MWHKFWEWIFTHWKGILGSAAVGSIGAAVKWWLEVRKLRHEGSTAKKQSELLDREKRIQRLMRAIGDYQRQLRKEKKIHAPLDLDATEFWLGHFSDEKREDVLDALEGLKNRQQNSPSRWRPLWD